MCVVFLSLSFVFGMCVIVCLDVGILVVVVVNVVVIVERNVVSDVVFSVLCWC